MAPQQSQPIKARSESHSDVARSKATKAYQQALTEEQFGKALVNRLREVAAPIRLGELREEWIETGEGVVHELSVDVLADE